MKIQSKFPAKKGGEYLKKIPVWYNPVTIALAAAALLVIPVIFIVLCAAFKIPFKGSHYDSHSIELVFENAPKGTVYIEPLIKLDSSDENYVEFAAAPKIVKYNNGEIVFERTLNIGADSEIVRLNTDGYVGISLHFQYSGGVEIYDNHTRFSTTGTTEGIDDIVGGYGGIKAAYVDENGRVLGITDAAECSYDRTEPNVLTADGSRLFYRVWGIAPQREAVLEAVAAAECISLAALAAVIVLTLISKIVKIILGRKMSG
ncbi:MAG: hypothetical protein K2J80_03835 [Oscillospiraceae bacterium]|nr:hypothetical protein [Oscillospiraceae bacterium]